VIVVHGVPVPSTAKSVNSSIRLFRLMNAYPF
jgi:hypothetical protein